VTSIPNGAAVDLSGGLDLDPLTSEIRTQGGWPFSAFSREATIVYVAGWGTKIPQAFNAAARAIIDELWSTQHGPAARPTMGGDATQMAVTPGFQFAVEKAAALVLTGTFNGLPFCPQVFA
jgi:hypothetical protein